MSGRYRIEVEFPASSDAAEDLFTDIEMAVFCHAEALGIDLGEVEMDLTPVVDTPSP